ncbi:MAG: hypothetical protein N2246_05050 [Candidatus Sumerlaeia bacterium]|nr:hypothetical protein [Candidatus Sumerlaeia bacterium]
MVWGDKEEAVSKTGKLCDGPDADFMASTYYNDTPILQQSVVFTGGPTGNNSFQRQDLGETGENLQNGNGITGHDETSERLDRSFIQAPPSPNRL